MSLQDKLDAFRAEHAAERHEGAVSHHKAL